MYGVIVGNLFRQLVHHGLDVAQVVSALRALDSLRLEDPAFFQERHVNKASLKPGTVQHLADAGFKCFDGVSEVMVRGIKPA